MENTRKGTRKTHKVQPSVCGPSIHIHESSSKTTLARSAVVEAVQPIPSSMRLMSASPPSLAAKARRKEPLVAMRHHASKHAAQKVWDCSLLLQCRLIYADK